MDLHGMVPIVDAWDDFKTWVDSSQFLANFLSGLAIVVVVAIASLLKKSWRHAIWGPVVSFFRWIGSIRLTTTKRINLPVTAPIRAAKQTEFEHQAEIAELQIKHDNEIVQIQKESKAREQSAIDAAAKAGRLADKERYEEGFRKAQEENKLAAEYGTSLASFAGGVARHTPRPRWLLYRAPDSGDNKDFVLNNPVARSVAYEVRLECSLGRFEFHDAAHWENLSGPQAGNFRGDIDDLGWARGLRFEIEWIDENGAQQMSSVVLPPAERDQN